MDSRGLTLSVLMATGVFWGCGAADKSKSDSAQGSGSGTQTGSGSDEAGLKSYGEDEKVCASLPGKFACVKGFISNNMKFSATWDIKSNVMQDVDGKDVSFTKTEFKDASDWGDKFDTVFLNPLLGKQSKKDYLIKVAPIVTNDNFSQGFSIIAQGADNKEQTIVLPGPGNFITKGVDFDKTTSSPDGGAVLRVRKEFRIEWEKRSTADASVPAPKSPVICLVMEQYVEKIAFDAGRLVKLGAIKDFKFYYQENDDGVVRCAPDIKQATEINTPPDVNPVSNF